MVSRASYCGPSSKGLILIKQVESSSDQQGTPVGWIARQSVVSPHAGIGTNAGQDQLSTEVGWRITRENPQNDPVYPQAASDPSEDGLLPDPAMNDDVSRETMTRDENDE